MKQWFLSRTSQEQILLGIGAVFVLIFLLYLIIWQPIADGILASQKRVEAKQATLSWMKQASHEVISLRNIGRPSTKTASNEALLSVVDRTARNSGIRTIIKRLKPQGETSVQLWLEKAPFDNLVQWLGSLNSQQQMLVNTLSLDRLKEVGLVNVRIELTRSNP